MICLFNLAVFMGYWIGMQTYGFAQGRPCNF